MSATSDEPAHLTSGYLALRNKDFRLDPEHPPLLRMWAAIPLLAQRNTKLPAIDISKVDPSKWVSADQGAELDYAFSFLYRMNDADHMLYSARFMISVLGVLLGVLIFCWVRELQGYWPAVAALGFYTFEPNILAHASLVTTDFGITCFLFGAIYFLWRTSRSLTTGNLAGLAVFTSLAAISKFSAIVLCPILLVLLAIQILRGPAWNCDIGESRQISSRFSRALVSLGVLLLIAATAWIAVWTAYGFRYLPSSAPGWQYTFDQNPAVHAKIPVRADVVQWVDEHHLLPNGYSEGLLVQQYKMNGRRAFLMGEISDTGWWYYFPFAFLIKTPISLIVFLIGGLAICALNWKKLSGSTAFILLPPGIYMAAAMSSGMDIGLRHILPVYPFIVVLAALFAAMVFRWKHRFISAIFVISCIFWSIEFARVYPHNLAFFNSFIGGPANGYKYLADSNVDWGQDLKGLKAWMDQNNVKTINLIYFGVADPVYYRIQCNYLAGGTGYDMMQKQISAPRLPGYVAISETQVDGVFLTPLGREYYAPLIDRRPVAVIGDSIQVFWAGDDWSDIKLH